MCTYSLGDSVDVGARSKPMDTAGRQIGGALEVRDLQNILPKLKKAFSLDKDLLCAGARGRLQKRCAGVTGCRCAGALSGAGRCGEKSRRAAKEIASVFGCGRDLLKGRCTIVCEVL